MSTHRGSPSNSAGLGRDGHGTKGTGSWGPLLQDPDQRVLAGLGSPTRTWPLPVLGRLQMGWVGRCRGGSLLWRGRQDGLVVIVLLLLLVEDLELEKELLLLQDPGVGGVQGWRPLVLFLVRGDVLVVLELLHLWLQLLGFLAAL